MGAHFNVCWDANWNPRDTVERHLHTVWAKPTAFLLSGVRCCSILIFLCVPRFLHSCFGCEQLFVASWKDRGRTLKTGFMGRSEVPRPDRQETKPGTLHWRALETDASCGHDLAARSSMDLREKVFEVKHRFAGHLARLPKCSLLFQVLSLRDLAWWRKQQKEHARLKDKWHGVQRFQCWRWESVFEKFFSNKQPDHRTVTLPIWAGNESRKTELLGWPPGLLLLRVHSRKELENLDLLVSQLFQRQLVLVRIRVKLMSL